MGTAVVVVIAAMYFVFVQSGAAWWARHGDVFVLDTELLVFGSEGRVALSRDLLTRPARDLPSWARELPSAPARSR